MSSIKLLKKKRQGVELMKIHLTLIKSEKVMISIIGQKRTAKMGAKRFV